MAKPYTIQKNVRFLKICVFEMGFYFLHCTFGGLGFSGVADSIAYDITKASTVVLTFSDPSLITSASCL